MTTIQSTESIGLATYSMRYDLPIATVQKQKKQNRFYDGWVWNESKKQLVRTR